jgi:hypothetical protein
MNIAPLASLGKIAGIGGISLGVVVLLGDKLVGTVAGLPATDRAPTVQLLTICCFGIGALGLLVWLIATRSGGTSAISKGKSSPAINAGGNVSVNAPIATPAPRSAQKDSSQAMPRGTARTAGDDSAAVNAGGSVTVNTETSGGDKPAS